MLPRYFLQARRNPLVMIAGLGPGYLEYDVGVMAVVQLFSIKII
jgi:hypothetical protein